MLSALTGISNLVFPRKPTPVIAVVNNGYLDVDDFVIVESEKEEKRDVWWDCYEYILARMEGRAHRLTFDTNGKSFRSKLAAYWRLRMDLECNHVYPGSVEKYTQPSKMR